ncbi:M4 family metallopeptidase [Lentzea flaviverrucosa]|uniref:Neutral metalloproteinase n=1 Tax=Lentzea flaviverrucosa TaxID=200379 RepID=A0A1H9ATV6_9PSEU|nr:M4 family metallopeptidase [Lentzea flaviverrucosa]RDI31966.1 thermolysin metallopeptidase-like protein [Lentzea flaviverrucosa]SEP80214.1 Thermolysin metallopeptidase, catalytic domain [Lentzea flaviverrucosa]
MVCSILPAHLLIELAEAGNVDLRDTIATLIASAALRTQRETLTEAVQFLDLNAAQLRGPAGEFKAVHDVRGGDERTLPGVLRRKEGGGAAADPAVNDAYDNADRTYDFYRDVLGRHSVDDNGLRLVSSVHFGRGFDNAFWDGTQMVYGDGSGEVFQPGALCRDITVVGHEITHGVVQYTAGLRYRKQPGALNESMADVFGSLVKQHSAAQPADQADWLIGAGILGTQLQGVALRSMKDPGRAHQFDRQPAHMRSYVDLPDDGDPRNDNGGVHINSGIPNKAFHLAATRLGGNAWDRAGKVWYDALATKLRVNSNFADAAAATTASAQALFGSDVAGVVRGAWADVGVS